jgi:hypothetical protein
LSDKLHSLGFQFSKASISLFHYKKGAITMFILIYVDIIVAGSSSSAIDALLRDLNVDFSLKDLGHLRYFLGIGVNRTATSLILSQEKYAKDLMPHVGMLAYKPAVTPLSSTEKLSAQGGEALSSPIMPLNIEALLVLSNILL